MFILPILGMFVRFRDDCRKDMPARNNREDLDRTYDGITFATESQSQILRWLDGLPASSAASPVRCVLPGPAGSGKTFLAIKHLVSVLLKPLEHTNVHSNQHLMLVTHSAAVLLGPMREQLKRELKVKVKGRDDESLYEQWLVPVETMSQSLFLRNPKSNVWISLHSIDSLLKSKVFLQW